MPESTVDSLTSLIRDIPDFPKPGILFRDITPLLRDAAAFHRSIELLADPFRDAGVTAVVAAEARGFIFACPLAVELDAGFVPVRKPGKLPHDTHGFDYTLEYGVDRLEMHVDGLGPGDQVLVVDDLLATGGTVEACLRLVKQTGAQVQGCAFLIELAALGGRAKIEPSRCVSLIRYD